MDGTDHVCAAMVGKLHIDANENQETVVHIAVPVETFATSSIAWKKSALELDSARLRARNFQISWRSLPASKNT
jgi:hypothetical protein